MIKYDVGNWGNMIIRDFESVGRPFESGRARQYGDWMPIG
jgi:hypothetical protein